MMLMMDKSMRIRFKIGLIGSKTTIVLVSGIEIQVVLYMEGK